MAITVKNSPHAKAAEQVAAPDDAVATKTLETGGEQASPPEVVHAESNPVHVPVEHERLTLGMAFKMPVADYTMLTFEISRSIPYPPGKEEETYELAKSWVEGKLNALIEEQTSD